MPTEAQHWAGAAGSVAGVTKDQPCCVPQLAGGFVPGVVDDSPGSHRGE